MKRNLLFIAFVALVLFSGITSAKEMVVTDVASRQVHDDTPVKRMILGEGRQINLLSVLPPFTVCWADTRTSRRPIRKHTPPMPQNFPN